MTQRKYRRPRSRYLRTESITREYCEGLDEAIDSFLDALDGIRVSRDDRNALRKIRKDATNGQALLNDLIDIAGCYVPPGHYIGELTDNYYAVVPSEDIVGCEDRDATADDLDYAVRHAGRDDVVFHVSDHGNILGAWDASYPGNGKPTRWHYVAID